YGVVRNHALQALQQLYNAIAGHPLVVGPSAVVHSMRTAIAADDRTTASVVSQSTSLLADAHKTEASVNQAAKQAALSPRVVASGRVRHRPAPSPNRPAVVLRRRRTGRLPGPVAGGRRALRRVALVRRPAEPAAGGGPRSARPGQGRAAGRAGTRGAARDR